MSHEADEAPVNAILRRATAVLEAHDAAKPKGGGRLPEDPYEVLRGCSEWVAKLADMLCSECQDSSRMRIALARIEKWFGEFPPTGKTWPESGEPMSYGAQYGSNGERDFMRGIARKAIDHQ